MIRCDICGEEVYTDHGNYAECDGKYICGLCRRHVSSWVSDRLIKVANTFSPVEIKCFLDDSLTGLADFLDELKDITED